MKLTKRRLKPLSVLVAVVLVGGALAEAGQSGPGRGTPPAQPADPIAQAYEQFLLAQRLEGRGDVAGAIAAYKRATALDPLAADVVSGLADLYMRQNRVSEAIATAEQALKVQPANQQAHRVLGTIYASISTAERPRGGAQAQAQNLAKAIRHLEQATAARDGGRVQADPNLRATLARLYVLNGRYDDAIPLLSELVKQEPGWQDGAALLAEAYAAGGRSDEAVRWLQESAPENPQLYATLADLHARGRRWRDAAAAYEQALQNSPRSFDLRVRYASMLLNAGGRNDILTARDALRQALSIRAGDERALYLLTQAERRAGEFEAAEATARRLVAQNGSNPRAYAALAEALEERRRYKEVVEALAPAVAELRRSANAVASLTLLLPHLGFAYQQLGAYDRAVATFEEARKISPRDHSITGYLIQAQLAAKNYPAAAELARAARADRPDDVPLARLEAEALRLSGKGDEGVAVLEQIVRRRGDDPTAHVALARVYADTNRRSQAVKVLQDANARFPADTTVAFELGAVLERQKKFAEAEAAFRQLLTHDPEHAPALNYLGYMLADRGERLDESVALIRRALQLDPENGSYLDSLGWAYFKEGKLDLAEEHLKRAAGQLGTNSVVQDHHGDVLFRLGRFDDAIDAWMRALAGDGDSIDRAAVDRKIRSARQKLPAR